MAIICNLFMVLCLTSLALSWVIEKNENIEYSFDEDTKWEDFKVKYSRMYESPQEEAQRRDLFIERLREVEEHNLNFKRGLVSSTRAINMFSDKYDSEIPRGLVPVEDEAVCDGKFYQSPITDAEIPDEIDWRTRGVVTNVKSQDQCGSCWAFSATGSLEGQLALKTGKLVSLSEQNIVDCDEYDFGCNGGHTSSAFKYIAKQGIDSEEAYPYEAVDGMCRFNKAAVVGIDKNCYRVKPTEEELKKAVATVGPISVTIDDSDNFQDYDGYVYRSSKCSSDPNVARHSVLVVGYGTTDEGEDYWLVKNSWGSWWGEDGYVRMARNNNNMCGIASMATFPIV